MKKSGTTRKASFDKETYLKGASFLYKKMISYIKFLRKEWKVMSWFTRAIDAAKRNDPAARSTAEIVLTYPGFHALFWHRFSHFL